MTRMSNSERQKRHYDRVIRPRRAAARRAKMEAWAQSVSFSDLEWIAGYFEGEGTVSILRGGREGSFKPVVCLASTDQEVICLFNSRWPAYVVGPRRPTANSRPVWTWRLTGALRVHYFLHAVWPHIRTERVRSKAAVVMAFCDRIVSEEYNRESDKSWKAPLVDLIRELNLRGRRDDMLTDDGRTLIERIQSLNLLPPPSEKDKA